MPHWYTTAQWCNQVPEDVFLHAHNTEINQGKLDSTGQYPLPSNLGGAPEEGLSKEGNAQEDGKEETQDKENYQNTRG